MTFVIMGELPLADAQLGDVLVACEQVKGSSFRGSLMANRVILLDTQEKVDKVRRFTHMQSSRGEFAYLKRWLPIHPNTEWVTNNGTVRILATNNPGPHPIVASNVATGEIIAYDKNGRADANSQGATTLKHPKEMPNDSTAGEC